MTPLGSVIMDDPSLSDKYSGGIMVQNGFTGEMFPVDAMCWEANQIIRGWVYNSKTQPDRITRRNQSIYDMMMSGF